MRSPDYDPRPVDPPIYCAHCGQAIHPQVVVRSDDGSPHHFDCYFEEDQ